MTIQPNANLYTQGFGSRPENVEVPHIDVRAPASTDINYPVGKRWIFSGNSVYDLIGLSTSNGVTSATWLLSAGGAGDVNQLTGDSGTATPTGGSIKIAGTANQITTTGSGSTITLALAGPYTPATYTAHGVLLGEGTSSIVATAAGTTGQTLMGSTGADPAFTGSPSFSGSVTAATGLTVTAGGAAITGTTTINTTGAGTTQIGNATNGLTIPAGGLTVTAGGATVTAGGLTVSAGGAGITGTTNINTTGAAVTSIGTGGTGATNIGNATGNTAVTGSLTASTSLTATLGAITATNGNLVLGTAGNKLISTSVASTTTAGANSFGTVTLSSGTATISTSAVTASSIIMLTRQSPGATGAAALGMLSIGTIMAGVSFVINALTTADSTAVATTDKSVIGWMIIN